MFLTCQVVIHFNTIGGLAGFAALADGADRFETYVDKLGQQ
jgi:hypothetical protein